MELILDSNIFNAVYRQIDNISNRYVVVYGGAGSGKSWDMAIRFVRISIQNRNETLLIIRKYKVTLRKSAFKLLKKTIDLFKLSKFATCNETDMVIRLWNKNEIYFVGADDTEKLKSIEGITGIWIEEATELTMEDFLEIDRRIRGNHSRPLQIFMTYNPVDKGNWTYRLFFDPTTAEEFKEYRDNCFILKTTYNDNKFIDAEYKKMLESQRGSAYTIYTLGDYGTPDYLVYKHWDIKPFPEQIEQAVYGLDFGFEHPMSLIQIHAIERDLYVREVIYERQLTIDELTSKMKALIPDNHIIYADSENPQAIQQLFNDNFCIYPVKKYAGSVNDGINLMQNFNIHIDPSSTNLMKEIQSYSRRVGNNGMVTETIEKSMDDGMDAMRYATIEHFVKEVNNITMGFIPAR